MSVSLAVPVGGIVVLLAGLVPQQARQVQIDVKPGDSPTVVERERGGFLPVAILSAAGFDALTVDPATVRVGPTGTEAEVVRSMQSDVNGDDRTDLMILVRVSDLKITCEVKAIKLTGTMQSGVSIEGSEAVVVDGCGGPGVGSGLELWRWSHRRAQAGVNSEVPRPPAPGGRGGRDRLGSRAGRA